MVTLNEISTYMIRNPEISLVIESHTDSRASDSYNQKLSELRANTVTKYLEEKGINEKRVSSAWFGNLKLIFDCPDESDCPDSNHQLNRRTELKLVIFPDKDKSYDIPKGATTADFQNSESISKWFLKKEN
jgi:outer membrane protein OmpA-like peptidoglycan-associated protein